MFSPHYIGLHLLANVPGYTPKLIYGTEPGSFERFQRLTYINQQWPLKHTHPSTSSFQHYIRYLTSEKKERTPAPPVLPELFVIGLQPLVTLSFYNRKFRRVLRSLCWGWTVYSCTFESLSISVTRWVPTFLSLKVSTHQVDLRG